MSEELKNYEFQYQQVMVALEEDPDNTELKNLAKDLADVISLTKEVEGLGGGSSGASSSSAPKKSKSMASSKPAPGAHQAVSWKIGDTCEARYAPDGRWYEATIQTMSADRSTYTVLFSGYNNTENISAKDLRQLKTTIASLSKQRRTTSGKKQQTSTDENEERKRRFMAKKEHQKEKAKIQDAKKNNWAKFSSKVQKRNKGSIRPTIIKKSIFATPDNPHAKVGVVGSGRGMTDFSKRGKHLYDTSKSS